MEFLTTQELETMEEKDLALYRSLLEQNMEPLSSSEIGNKIGEVRDIIVKKVMASMEKYFVNITEYPETALTVREDKSRFDLLDKVYNELVTASENNKQVIDIGEVEKNKKDIAKKLVEIYISQEYPIEIIEAYLGKDKVDRILGKSKDNADNRTIRGSHNRSRVSSNRESFTH